MAIGPVQMLVLGFAEPNFTGKIAAELDRLRQLEFIKIVDALVVNKDENGDDHRAPGHRPERGRGDRDGRDRRRTDRLRLRRGEDDAAVEAGAELGAEAMADGHLIPEEDAWYVADAIPNGSAAAIILHRAPLGDPAPERDRRGRRHRARGRVDPPEGPDRRRRRCRGGVERARDPGWPRLGGYPGRARHRRSPTPDRPALEPSVSAMTDPTSTPATPTPDAVTLLRSRSYVMLLVFGAILGVPVATVAYFFLKGVAEVQQYVYDTLPGELGFDTQPSWWSIPILALSGLLVALTISHLRGTAGHKPAEGFKASGPVQPIDLPAIIIASFATLSLGVVLGPEAPLIAIGSGLGVLAVHLLKRDAPTMASVVIGAAGSFAAISTLLGSPLPAAFLMMEVVGLGGTMLAVVLMPGLLAAGIGSLIFVGLGDWTGFGTFSLAVPDIPPAGSPDLPAFLWAIAIGIAAAILGLGLKRLSLLLQPLVERRMVMLMPVVGVAIGILVLIFVETTGRSSSEVLFSGQDQLPGLIEGAAGWSVGALVMVVVCKGLAYALSLSSFRGGPIFPSMFIGAAGGIALSHLPGLPLIAGAAMGIGALMVAMLGLPLTSVLIVTLFLQADGLELLPLVIVAVVVSYVVTAWVAAPPAPTTQAEPATA